MGITFRPQSAPEELQTMVVEAEAAGIEQLWLWEDCFYEGGFTTAAAALSWSSQIRVGLGLVPVPLRNPALTAMEIATIARLWPGRFTVALGHGVAEWMAQVGRRVDSPMTLLREHTRAIRQLLDGEEVSVEGKYVKLDRVKLAWPPAERPELIVGGRGPRTIALAGSEADGVLLDTTSDVDKVREAREIVDEARVTAGRGGRSKVYVYTAIDLDDSAPSLVTRLAETVARLEEAGADKVLVHGSDKHPHGVDILRELVEGTRAT